MNIHEYQAKAVLKEFGVPVSRGIPVLRAVDAVAAAEELGGPVWVVKSHNRIKENAKKKKSKNKKCKKKTKISKQLKAYHL